MKKIYFVGIVALCSIISSCKKKPSLLENYDRSILLTNIADSVIHPAYQNLYNNIDELNNEATAFNAAPSVASLNTLKNSWNNCVATWMYCEGFNFGYANTAALNSQIASTPANFQVIEDEIHGTNSIDENYIAATGTTRKGLSAIEYLLYGDNASEQSIVDSFTTSSFALRRQTYLQALCMHIKTQSGLALADWNGGSSYTSFISQTQLDISGSLNLYVNSLTEHIELVRKTKVGKPAGIDDGGVIDGSLCEYRLTPRSIENIRENIRGWKNVFNGKNGIGLDDYLNHVNAQYNGSSLSETINNQIDVCLQKANDITVPLHLAVTQQPTQVNALHLELKKLTVLTKVDMASNLGVIITFSDNDGD